MKRSRWSVLAGLLILGGLLSGCVSTVVPPQIPEMPVTMPDYALVGEANYAPAFLEDDPYPLFVGARWVYRNAATYWNPQISASGLMESEVVAVVQGDDAECYVLRTHYSNGPDELLYIRRTANQVKLVDADSDAAAPGAQSTYSLNPGLVFLQFPLAEDNTWPLVISGAVGRATVYHTEVVAIESGEVRTLLGPTTPIYTGSWRIHYDLPAAAPRLYGGSPQFLWFAPGVGVVKHVLNSVNYELAEYRRPDEVVHLEERHAGGIATVDVGEIVIVELRGGAPGHKGAWTWELTDMDGAALAALDSDFYADAPQVIRDTEAGTYVFKYRAVDAGDVTLEFEAVHATSGRTEGPITFRIVVD